MFPSQWSTIFNKVVLQMSEKAFGRLPKEWRFNVLPPPGQMCNPIINDKVVDRFWSGEITVVHNLAAVQPTGEPKLVDGTVLSDVDTIIFCTGYEYDLSILSDDVNPVLNPHPEWDRLPSTAGKPLVDLYQGIYSLDYPQSLAIIGLVGYPASHT
jgi:dimethylaniline monooxygenase (N-oxide forming)